MATLKKMEEIVKYCLYIDEDGKFAVKESTEIEKGEKIYYSSVFLNTPLDMARKLNNGFTEDVGWKLEDNEIKIYNK